MTPTAGHAPATDNRRNTSAEAQAEEHIRTAHALLSAWGVPMSHNRVVKHVRRFVREVSGWSFFDYFANVVQIDGDRRDATRTELDAYLRTTYALDPTGVTAVRNVSGGHRA